MNPIRVLFVTGGLRIGGMETHLLRLIPMLPEYFRCAVCCLNASTEYRARLLAADIEHVDLSCPSLVHPRAPKAYLNFERLIRRFRPHILHSYGFVADVMVGILGSHNRRIQIITSRRGEDTSRRHQRIRRIVNGLSARVVCVSHQTARFVQRTESPPPGLLEVIPNGVPFASTGRAAGFLDKRNTIRFGTLGTVKPVKGTDILVDAFLKFTPTRQVELVVAGLLNRPWAEDLKARASADPRIRFVGHASDTSRILAGLDVFVLPSRSEGMSNALLEAMAAGLPCIATDVGSNRSLLAPTSELSGGLICKPDPESLFRAMDLMASCGETRQAYGVQASNLVTSKGLSIQGMAERYARLYRAVLGTPETRVPRTGWEVHIV